MAKRLYDAAANGLDTGDYAWLTGTWKVSLLSSVYTFSSAHDFFNDLSGVIASAAITGRTKPATGIWDADDVPFTGVAGGSTVVAVVIWKDTGNAATSPLFLFDDATLLGVPFATDGNDFTFAWDNGPAMILKIPTTF